MNEWTWNKLITSRAYYELDASGFPGWAKQSDGSNFVMRAEFEFGSPWSSHALATEIDDLIKYQFWYRDFTESGLPWGDDGEKYDSLFVFQNEDDYKRALKNYLDPGEAKFREND